MAVDSRLSTLFPNGLSLFQCLPARDNLDPAHCCPGPERVCLLPSSVLPFSPDVDEVQRVRAGHRARALRKCWVKSIECCVFLHQILWHTHSSKKPAIESK